MTHATRNNDTEPQARVRTSYMGRKAEVLFGSCRDETTFATEIEAVQRQLVVLMRENGILIPR